VFFDADVIQSFRVHNRNTHSIILPFPSSILVVFCVAKGDIRSSESHGRNKEDRRYQLGINLGKKMIVNEAVCFRL